MKPVNYRTNPFHLFGQNITIAAMAGPYSNIDSNAALSYLRTEGRTVLIGLHETDFTPDARRNGLEYHHIPVPDFAEHPISPAIYDAIYAIVKKATEEGKQVTIHCRAGNGRSGTALASMKLRELLEEQARVTPSILDERPGNTVAVHASFDRRDIPCTALVKTAVERIRHQGDISSDSGSRSIETYNDVRTLIEYEHHLRTVIKTEFREERIQQVSNVYRSAPRDLIAHAIDIRSIAKMDLKAAKDAKKAVLAAKQVKSGTIVATTTQAFHTSIARYQASKTAYNEAKAKLRAFNTDQEETNHEPPATTKPH